MAKPQSRNAICALGTYLLAVGILATAMFAALAVVLSVVTLLSGSSLTDVWGFVFGIVAAHSDLQGGFLLMVALMPVGMALYGIGCLLPANASGKPE